MKKNWVEKKQAGQLKHLDFLFCCAALNKANQKEAKRGRESSWISSTKLCGFFLLLFFWRITPLRGEL